MEDNGMRKKGPLFLLQQRFGKRWRKVWCVLFRESHCSVSRLEIYDWNERSDKSVRKPQDKKVIRLSSCIRVSLVDVDGSPKDTSAFLIETTDKIFVFAADKLQVEEWTQGLCEIAFPMNWSGSALQRGSSQRNTRSEPNLSQDHKAATQDNSLYSLLETGTEEGQDFRVVVRRSEASDRCRLKGEALLRAETEALLLKDKSGQVLYSWPYRFLRRFGRDKSSFTFEAGRRCESGPGNFEFDTKLGNALFVAVETAINRQRVSLPHRQTSMASDSLPHMSHPQTRSSTRLDSHPPITRSLPPRPEDLDPVYSLVNDKTLQITHLDKESSPSQRHPMFLEPPVDKTLTAVKSLTLENRDPPLHKKNQVKMISSCPLPGDNPHSARDHSPSEPGPKPPTQTYSRIGAERKKKKSPNGSVDVGAVESEYSQPFDLLIPDLRELGVESERPPLADPVYDSIDEFKIRNVFHRDRGEHIYDEPESCHSEELDFDIKTASASVYDEPQEMRVEAWRIMGTEQDPKGHEFPYNARVDDYAVPKHVQRAYTDPQTEAETRDGPERDQSLDLEMDPEQTNEVETGENDSPYNNLPVKTDNQKQ
ncbi:unnamed protein product [Knipowitschia caucasica]|uniref:Docking protein 2 n=1 Tax=Knipowitschia caucasica TaxID=637954 RepID=A0AAV2MPS0_KNICA